MTGVFVGGKPLSKVVDGFDGNDTGDDTKVKNPKKQKFVKMHRHPELHITGCAVSKMKDIDKLPEVEGFNDFFIEPNANWLENRADDRAWVKVYHWINPETDSVIKGRIQTLTIKMPFLGESVDECWGETQINVKKTVIRNGKKVYLELVKFGRHRSFDTRRGEFGEWVEETKPIEPKMDVGTHGYVSFRLYHQDHLSENQPDWSFQPVYVSVAGEDFYRIDAIWQSEEIVITATLLDDDSDEIPKFLRQ